MSNVRHLNPPSPATGPLPKVKLGDAHKHERVRHTNTMVLDQELFGVWWNCPGCKHRCDDYRHGLHAAVGRGSVVRVKCRGCGTEAEGERRMVDVFSDGQANGLIAMMAGSPRRLIPGA